MYRKKFRMPSVAPSRIYSPAPDLDYLCRIRRGSSGVCATVFSRTTIFRDVSHEGKCIDSSPGIWGILRPLSSCDLTSGKTGGFCIVLIECMNCIKCIAQYLLFFENLLLPRHHLEVTWKSYRKNLMNSILRRRHPI